VGQLRSAPNHSVTEYCCFKLLKEFLGEYSIGSDRRANGIPFQTKGPITEKARLCMHGGGARVYNYCTLYGKESKVRATRETATTNIDLLHIFHSQLITVCGH